MVAKLENREQAPDGTIASVLSAVTSPQNGWKGRVLDFGTIGHLIPTPSRLHPAINDVATLPNPAEALAGSAISIPQGYALVES